MREIKIVCPMCGRADAVRKVTAIVDEGTTYTDSRQLGMSISKGDDQYHSGLGSAISYTGLASTLAAPKKPHQPSLGFPSSLFPNFRWSCVGIALVLTTLLSICSFPLLYPTYSQNALLLLIPILIFVVTAIVLIRWAWLSNQREARILRHANARYPNAVATWQMAVARWEQLYYCYRDDGVFIAKQTRLVNSKDMLALLYAPQRKKGSS